MGFPCWILLVSFTSLPSLGGLSRLSLPLKVLFFLRDPIHSWAVVADSFPLKHAREGFKAWGHCYPDKQRPISFL